MEKNPLISLIVPYYNQPQMLKEQERYWKGYPEEVEIIVIDDGSQKYPAETDYPLYRVLEDIPWNVSGAKNLGMHVAKGEWLLFCDIDHVFKPSEMKKIVKFLKDE